MTDRVPPRVKLPDVVTVPVRVNPLTVPVPPTLVTVPLPPPPLPVDTAVTNPLALTVTVALVNVPTLEFTVANVPAAVTLPDPSKLGLV